MVDNYYDFGLALGTGLFGGMGHHRADGSLCFSDCWPLKSFFFFFFFFFFFN